MKICRICRSTAIGGGPVRTRRNGAISAALVPVFSEYAEGDDFHSAANVAKMAIAVKCPLHGERFKPPRFQIYVSKWLREKQSQLLWSHHSEQYRKAWFATFPTDLWPAHEMMEQQGMILKLKDGTKIPA